MACQLGDRGEGVPGNNDIEQHAVATQVIFTVFRRRLWRDQLLGDTKSQLLLNRSEDLAQPIVLGDVDQAGVERQRGRNQRCSVSQSCVVFHVRQCVAGRIEHSGIANRNAMFKSCSFQHETKGHDFGAVLGLSGRPRPTRDAGE